MLTGMAKKLEQWTLDARAIQRDALRQLAAVAHQLAGRSQVSAKGKRVERDGA